LRISLPGERELRAAIDTLTQRADFGGFNTQKLILRELAENSKAER
jgi:hypothetical protein